MIWVGEGEPSLACLAVGVPGQECPATQVLDHIKSPGITWTPQVIGSSDQSLQLASRLAKKLSKQVFMSWTLAEDVLFTPLVVARLIQEIKQNPDMF